MNLKVAYKRHCFKGMTQAQLPPQLAGLKIALAHDYLSEYGGAERVLEALHDLFPTAPVYVSFADPQALGAHWQRFASWDIRQSWLTKLPFYKKLFSPYRAFAPQFFSSFDLSAFDLVISSSNAYFAKAVRVPNGRHVCYCHTPPRSLYGYTTLSDWKSKPIIGFFGQLLNHYLRVVDYQVSQRVDTFVANSAETQRRIAKFYRKNSVVIYPPVVVPAVAPTALRANHGETGYFLYVNRLALAKHPEIAVEACARMGVPLKVVGQGKMLPVLKKIAANYSAHQIEFLGGVGDEKLAELYAGARALLYPVEYEDFGMVPVEAMGHGVPVIAHASGGPLETVIDGHTGVLFDDLNVAGLQQAIEKFQKLSFSPKAIHSHATQFNVEQFQRKIINLVSELRR